MGGGSHQVAQNTHPRLRVVDGAAEDARLLERARAGDPEVGAALYDRFADLVNRVVYRVMGADTELDDLVQQVFIKVLGGIGRVEDPAALQAWVCAICVNTVRSEIRRRRIRSIVRSSPHPPDTFAAETDHEARALLRQVYGVLDRLPVEQRLAFTLRFIDGRSLTEVAQMCGCSLATVKRRIVRARERFEVHARRHPDLVERLEGGEGRDDD